MKVERPYRTGKDADGYQSVLFMIWRIQFPPQKIHSSKLNHFLLLYAYYPTFCISLFSLQYSIDNYEERRKYELQAERMREEMQARLGSSTSNEMDSQNERLNALRRVESQINELKRMEGQTHSGSASSAGAGGRIIQQPRSANLEQLYHEAIPMDKALSHSGPSAFGNGQGGLLQQHPVSLQIFLHIIAVLQGVPASFG